MAIRVALYLHLVLACIGTAHAELSFTQLIFDDCDKASEYFSAAPPAERKTLSEHLTNILSINLIPPSSPEAFATNQQLSLVPEVQLFNGNSGDKWLGLQWKNMDAQRELKAKHCALTTLEAAGADAFHQILPLAKIYQANSLSDELSVRLEEVAFRIAESSHLAGIEPSEELIHQMLALITSGDALVVENFLEEYREKTIPIVLRSFAKLAGQNHENSVRLLLHLDRSEPLLQIFLEILPHLDQESVAILSPLISVHSITPNNLALSDIIGQIDDNHQSETLLHLIGRACLESSELPLSAESSAILKKLVDLWKPQRLQIDQVRCLLRRSPPLVRNLLESVQNSPHSEQAKYFITLLSSPDSYSNREISEQAYFTLQYRALDITSPNAVHALNALSSFERFSTENSNTAIRLLNRYQSAKISQIAKQVLTESSLRLLKDSGKGEANSLYAPTILGIIRDESLSQTAIDLLASLPSLPNRLWWMAGSSLRTPAARNALKIISKRKQPHLRLASNLIPLLNVQTESPYAAEILYALRNDIAPSLKASYPSSDVLATDSLSIILSGITKPEQVYIERAVQVFQIAPCSFSQERIGILRGSTLTTQPVIKAAALNHLKRCLPTYPPSSIIELTKNNSPVVELLASSLNDSANTPQTAEWISALMTGLPITPDSVEEYAPLLAALIKMSPEPIKGTLLKTIDNRKSLPSIILTTLKSMLAEMEFGPEPQRWEIVALLAHHAPDSLNLVRILESAGDQLHDDNPSRIYQTLGQLPNKESLSIIHNNLKSSDRQVLVNASLIGAAFGSRALPIVSQLWNLRLHKDPTIRYAAVLALLAVNPLSPDLQQALARILTNRMYGMALVMPVPWSKTLAFIELDEGRFGALRRSRIAALREAERLRTG